MDFLKAFNPSYQVVYCRDLVRVHMGRAPTIGLVVESFGRNVAESFLEIQLNDLSEFAGCKEKLKTHQITELARIIIESYGYFKVSEFMLFFQRFKRCEYGKFYGAVDPMVIMEGLASFSDERAHFIDKIRQEEARAAKAEEEKAYEALKLRYMARVPDAFADNAPINFLQYRLMGYDNMTDEEIKNECEEISSGRKKIPEDVISMLNIIRDAFL